MYKRQEYVRRLESRMKPRLDAITSEIGIEEVEADMSDNEFNEFVARVGQYLQIIDDR